MDFKRVLQNWRDSKDKSVITWSEIQDIFNISDYVVLCDVINQLESSNLLKNYGKGVNGRKPSLFMKYKIVSDDIDYSKYIEEIDYELAPEIDKSYYKGKISSYVKDRELILAISNYIKNKKHLLDTRISINERSFDVFNREKCLKQKGMNSILKNLGLSEHFFNCYETSEPISYYSVSKERPQNVLIIENKDTFYSIRKYIKSVSKNVLGIDISTVIYGAGNGRLPSMSEIEDYTEDYISNDKNTFYYFGDIDYAGISIYENYCRRNEGKITWIPFNVGYEYILDKTIGDNYSNLEQLPDTKEGQKDTRKGIFMEFFSDEYKEKISTVLSNRKYIPQEALNFYDLISYMEEEE